MSGVELSDVVSVAGIDSLAALVEQLQASRPLTRPYLITIDGPSGAGKTTLASAIARALGASVVHTDDFIPGWHALEAGIDLIARHIVEPLSSSRPARIRSYDWEQRRSSGWIDIPVASAVVIEGCGAGAIANYELVTSRIWLDADAAERTERLRTRDNWAGYAPYREAWRRQEDAVTQKYDPRGRATHRLVSIAGGRFVEDGHTTTREGAPS